MPAYFVDSWFLIASGNRVDNDHAAVRRLEARLADTQFVTHDGVLSEVLTHFCEAGAFNRQRAVTTVRRALQRFVVEALTRDLFMRGLELYSRRIDKGYSHVDCVSMIVMEDFGIEHVLTKDHHFTQAGFTVLSDAP
jgi:predicted nucleic acid-binding protein